MVLKPQKDNRIRDKINIKKNSSEVNTIINQISPSSIQNIQEVDSIIEDNYKVITSPVVGTFYSKSSPTASPYVHVGQKVKKGDVLCIIEAMKLMNEIEAEASGKITEICVQNGDSVEFGQVLMYVE